MNRHIIFLNENLTKQQEWQDFAHELCHVLRHVGRQEDLPYSFYQLKEWQDNSFMYHLCLPTLLEKIKLESTMHRSTLIISEAFRVEYEFAYKKLEMYIRKYQLTV
ncbi:ImmA/IrrE family metallo-endopeptidase [Bacillaceae bacterium S4-13-56]